MAGLAVGAQDTSEQRRRVSGPTELAVQGGSVWNGAAGPPHQSSRNESPLPARPRGMEAGAMSRICAWSCPASSPSMVCPRVLRGSPASPQDSPF